jgi:O-antigen ligase
MWNITARNPILGVGPANYYYYTPQFPILGWYVRFVSHNNYIDLIAQVGIVGLVAFVWLAFEIGLVVWRLYRSLPSGFAKAYAAGALGGLIATLASGLLGDWIFPFYYNAGLVAFRSSLLAWVFLGGALALNQLRLGQQQSQQMQAATEFLRPARMIPRSI